MRAFLLLLLLAANLAHAACDENRLRAPVQDLLAITRIGLKRNVVDVSFLERFVEKSGWSNLFEPVLSHMLGTQYHAMFDHISGNFSDPQRAEFKSALRALIAQERGLERVEHEASELTKHYLKPKLVGGTQEGFRFNPEPFAGSVTPMSTIAYMDSRPVVYYPYAENGATGIFSYDPFHPDPAEREVRHPLPEVRGTRLPSIVKFGSKQYLAFLPDGLLINLETWENEFDQFTLREFRFGVDTNYSAAFLQRTYSGDAKMWILEPWKEAMQRGLRKGVELVPITSELTVVEGREIVAHMDDERYVWLYDMKRGFIRRVKMLNRESAIADMPIRVFGHNGYLIMSVAAGVRDDRSALLVDIETGKFIDEIGLPGFGSDRLDEYGVVTEQGSSHFFVWLNTDKTPYPDCTYNLLFIRADGGERFSIEAGQKSSGALAEFDFRGRKVMMWASSHEISMFEPETRSRISFPLEIVRPFELRPVVYKNHNYAFTVGNTGFQLLDLASGER